MVFPGLESIAAQEIVQDLRAEVKKTEEGIVIFRAPEINSRLLHLRTVEDVFLFAWGTDELTYRAADLERIRRWTDREADWAQLLRIHHAIRPKPKGKPSFRIVVQMSGKHGYRRVDARKALAEGLAGKLPASWRYAEENASVEFWLTINNATAVCGLRLSDRSMRHRAYKKEHAPASLRPTIAAAMVRLAELKPLHMILDPMCGVGTILAEILGVPARYAAPPLVLGGDVSMSVLRAAGINLRRLGKAHLLRWDATALPLADESIDRIVCNPPFGKQLASPEQIPDLYRGLINESHRVLRTGGRAVILTGDVRTIKESAAKVGWKSLRQLRVRVLGMPAAITVWKKE
jgi:23S rRNA G2445 N2-methylase RlmL